MIGAGLDRALLRQARRRSAAPEAGGVFARAWNADGTAHHADMAGAQGRTAEAALADEAGWGALARGEPGHALEAARARASAVLEAEALMSAGAVRRALARLGRAHEAGVPEASMALARRLHHLGAHADAWKTARQLPLHAGAALIGAQAALALGRAQDALELLEPVLEGAVALPDNARAARAAVLGASALARTGAHERLRRMAKTLLEAGDLEDAALPDAVRVAWTAGEGAQAWTRVERGQSPGARAAQVVLAVLAGDAGAARDAAAQAPGPSPGVGMLNGEIALDAKGRALLDDATKRVHVWCTSDLRFAPWVQAARASAAEVTVWDWRSGVVPDADEVPDMVLEDGALMALIEPQRIGARAKRAGSGVHIATPPCGTIAVGLEWPASETRRLEEKTGATVAMPDAGWVVGDPGTGLEAHARGCGCVVIAPPGDPYWNGPLPERGFERLRVVRADPAQGWEGAGARAGEALAEMGGPGHTE